LWLLLPPVWWVLRSRRENQYRRSVTEEMDDRDLLAFLSFRDVLNGWAYVAAGAALIAVKETWELHEAYEWPEWVFWGLIVVMLIICVASTRARHQHRQARPAIED
jgi:hypothetical protein